MKIWQAVVLGAIQGLTEFLPVSSSGHLLLAERWLNVNTENGLFFDIMLHLGTLIPVFIVFRKGIKGLFKKPFRTLSFLFAASVPAALAGFLLQDKIEALYKGKDFLSAALLSVSFAFTAAELFFAGKFFEKNKNTLPLSLKSSIIMGVFQGFAIIPGVSRSGTVITGGTIAKLDRNINAEFAFLMSIPVILGAALVSGAKAVTVGVKIELLPVIAGVVSAAVTGYIAVGITLKAIRNADYKWFSLYLIVIAAASLLTQVIFGI